MPLDHYVSQVHLRNFYSDGGKGPLVGVKKDDLKLFRPWSDAVCRLPNGSTNSYLVEPRVIEAFLERIEPKYNAALEALRSRELDVGDIYTLAGFVAYVMSCSPAAMRMNSAPIAANLELAAKLLDAQGLLPPTPQEIGNTTFTQILDGGFAVFKVDSKYPQAIGISQINEHLFIIGNAKWEILLANAHDGRFFTSDFPIAFGPSYDSRVASKTVPLAPDIAIRIHPQLRDRGKAPDFSFPNFAAVFKRPDSEAIRKLNRAFVRAAETMVFYSAEPAWLLPFVKRNREYRSDATITVAPTPRGDMIVAHQAIVTYKRPVLPRIAHG